MNDDLWALLGLLVLVILGGLGFLVAAASFAVGYTMKGGI